MTQVEECHPPLHPPTTHIIIEQQATHRRPKLLLSSHWTFTDVPNHKPLKKSLPFSTKYDHDPTTTLTTSIQGNKTKTTDQTFPRPSP